MDNEIKKTIISSILFIIISSVIAILVAHFVYPKNEITKEPKLNDVNTYSDKKISQREMAIIYLNDYINNAIYYPDKAYKKLSSTYKKQFKNYEDYKRYITENENEIYSSELKTYTIFTRGKTTKYTCITESGVTYEFETKGVLDYKVNVIK